MWWIASALAEEPVIVDPIVEIPGLVSTTVTLKNDALSISPAAPEHPPMGPDRLRCGLERCVIYNPSKRQLVWVFHGAVEATQPWERLDALAAAPNGDALVLSGSTVHRISPSGVATHLKLSGLVPSQGSWTVLGDELVAIDLFGNEHPIALVATGLVATTGPALRPSPHQVKRQAPGFIVDDATIDVGDAERSGVQPLQGGWVVVDRVWSGADGIRAERSVWNGGRSVLVPRGDVIPAEALSVAPNGHLWMLVPRLGGTDLIEVTP